MLLIFIFFRPNIELSAFSTSPISFSSTHTRYIPPHPQKGTPYHRYVLLLLPQPSSSEPISVPAYTDEQRLGFDFRAFAAQYSLDASTGGAAHMWREVWDETVTQIYKDVLSTLFIILLIAWTALTDVVLSLSETEKDEPRYGRLPKEDRYEEVKNIKKYL